MVVSAMPSCGRWLVVKYSRPMASAPIVPPPPGDGWSAADCKVMAASLSRLVMTTALDVGGGTAVAARHAGVVVPMGEALPVAA